VIYTILGSVMLVLFVELFAVGIAFTAPRGARLTAWRLIHLAFLGVALAAALVFLGCLIIWLFYMGAKS
jgi:hypothetical protein